MTTATENDIQVDIEVLPKQRRFINAVEREVLYSGAFGAGKSRSICLKVAIRASTPGAREGLCRKHLVTLKATTLKTLLERDGELPPVLPPGTYTHNKNERVIRINGGGEIQYFGLDDPDKIGSYNLTGCGVDEAVEVSEKDWTQLRGRIRVKVGGLPNQLYGACNPGPPSHFLAKRFGLAQGHHIAPNCLAIQTKSTDNIFLPHDYIEDLKSFKGLARKRYVDGLWVGSDGLVYDLWDRNKFVASRSGPWKRVVVGQDEGYTNPAVMLVGCLDGDGRLHIAREWYHSKKLERDVIDQAKALRDDFEAEAFVVDPSAAKLIAAMENEGLNVVRANNDVFGGIQAVQQRLDIAGDGRPRITVDPTCENTIREFETYEWKKNKKDDNPKDEPVKENDHAMDALRYMVMEIDGGVAVTFEALGQDVPLHEDDYDEDDEGWTTFGV